VGPEARGDFVEVRRAVALVTVVPVVISSKCGVPLLKSPSSSSSVRKSVVMLGVIWSPLCIKIELTVRFDRIAR
jgi:hypothetical protein